MNPSNPTDAEAERARLDKTRREIERLNRLRQSVANGLLEVSEAAKRDADRLMSDAPQAAPSGAADERHAHSVQTTTSRASVPSGRGWSGAFLSGAFAVGLGCGFLLAVFLGGPASEPSVGVSEASQPAPEVAEVPSSPTDAPASPSALTPDSPPTEAPQRAPATAPGSGFVLTLTPSRTCWLRSRVDGHEPLERLLPPGRTIVLEVEEEASLRIGDAAAMTLLINDQPTKALGGEGQAVSVRITSANLESFLLDLPRQ